MKLINTSIILLMLFFYKCVEASPVSSVEDLPLELSTKIFNYLDHKSFINAMQVSSKSFFIGKAQSRIVSVDAFVNLAPQEISYKIMYLLKNDLELVINKIAPENFVEVAKYLSIADQKILKKKFEICGNQHCVSSSPSKMNLGLKFMHLKFHLK